MARAKVVAGKPGRLHRCWFQISADADEKVAVALTSGKKTQPPVSNVALPGSYDTIEQSWDVQYKRV